MSVVSKMIHLFSALKAMWAGSPRERFLGMMPKGSICAEIGVWKGEFSRQILAVVRPGKLHLIDPWKYQTDFGERLYGGAFAKKQEDMDAIFREVADAFANRKEVTIHRDFSESAASSFEDGYFDWVYIDGNHYYDFVKKDLELFYPKVRKGGFLAGDDYLWTSPELNGDLPVKRAVDEFVSQRPGLTLKVMSTQFIIKTLS